MIKIFRHISILYHIVRKTSLKSVAENFSKKMSHIVDKSIFIIYTNCVKYMRHIFERRFMNRVKEYRQMVGKSQLALAKEIGVSRQTINMIENNKYNPSLELCINLALALNTDLNSLFWLKGE